MRISIVAVAAAFLAAPGAAQQDFSKVEVKVERLAPGVAVLFGAGGNIGLSYGDDGNAIVDDQYAPLTPKIVAAVRALDPDPIRFVINTHWHGDHTGGNESLGRAGAVILAHDNVRIRLSSEQFMRLFNERVPASPKAALPVVTFSDDASLHLNGDTLRIIHVEHAHTDGDSLVHWQKSNVLHMGDTFFNKVTFPFIDLDSGGSIDGMIKAAEQGLAMANDQTRIIPGHGPVATRAELAAYRDMLVDVRTKVAAGIAAKQSLEQIKGAKPVARYGMTDGFMKPDQFIEIVYRDLSNPRRQAGGDNR
jgi:cyclase